MIRSPLSSWRLLSLCCIAQLASPGIAAAQSVPAQPAVAAPRSSPSSPGVFGGASGRETPSTGIVVTVAEAWDQNVLAGDGAPRQTTVGVGGFFTDLGATFTTHLSRRNLQFNAGAGGTYRYYSQQHAGVALGNFGSAGIVYTSGETTIAVDGGI